MEKEKMLAGESYRATGPELMADAIRADRLLRVYKGTEVEDEAGRAMILLELLGRWARARLCAVLFIAITVTTSIWAAEFRLCIFGLVQIAIGDGRKIGPYVQVLSADHPRDPALRKQRLEHGQPITIGANVWISGGALILPGNTVSDDATIGAGSVVMRDVAAGTTVIGNPARRR